jgi:hypothetical protein
MSGGRSSSVPQEVAGEADVFPGERRRVGKQSARHGLARVAQVLHGVSQVGRIPIDVCRDHEVQPRCPELLRLLAAVGDAASLERADDLGQRVALLALFKPTWQRWRRSGDSSQSNVNKVRSTRPNSCSARSSWFCR